MEKAADNYVKINFIICAIATAWIVCVAVSHTIHYAGFYSPNISNKDKKTPLLTSTDYRYNDRFLDTLKKYDRFRYMYQHNISSPIPGLQYTQIGNAICGQIVPQGICIAGDYMLITGYDNGRNYKKEANRSEDYTPKNSVIYVLSNQDPTNRTYLTTIVLPDVNHVGGIAFDGRYVWIAKSTTGKCSIIDYKEIKRAVLAEKSSYHLEAYTAEADCGVTASFVTYYEGRLWVGTYRSRINGKGSLQSFDIVKIGNNFTLVPKQKAVIPSYANGVIFTEVGNRTCMAVSTSQGRYGDSKIYMYEVLKAKEAYRYVPKGVHVFPPMAEEMVTDGENTYILFESAATAYSTLQYKKCSYPVDRICGIESEKLFSWAKIISINSAGIYNSKARFSCQIDWAYHDRRKYYHFLSQAKG